MSRIPRGRLALASVLVLGLAGFGAYFGMPGRTIVVPCSHAVYRSVDELLNNCDIVVVGEVIKDLCTYSPTIAYNEWGRPGEFFTVTDVRVSKALKGNIPGGTISVMQAAAYYDWSLKNQKDLLTLEGFSPMMVGKQYVLFLKLVRTGIYSIIGVDQGKFNIDGTDEREDTMADFPFRVLKPLVLEAFRGRI